jgi:hypothetical protein
VVRRRRARRRRRPWGILRVGECDGGETAIDGVFHGDGSSATARVTHHINIWVYRTVYMRSGAV